MCLILEAYQLAERNTKQSRNHNNKLRREGGKAGSQWKMKIEANKSPNNFERQTTKEWQPKKILKYP